MSPRKFPKSPIPGEDLRNKAIAECYGPDVQDSPSNNATNVRIAAMSPRRFPKTPIPGEEIRNKAIAECYGPDVEDSPSVYSSNESDDDFMPTQVSSKMGAQPPNVSRLPLRQTTRTVRSPGVSEDLSNPFADQTSLSSEDPTDPFADQASLASEDPAKGKEKVKKAEAGPSDPSTRTEQIRAKLNLRLNIPGPQMHLLEPPVYLGNGSKAERWIERCRAREYHGGKRNQYVGKGLSPRSKVREERIRREWDTWCMEMSPLQDKPNQPDQYLDYLHLALDHWRVEGGYTECRCHNSPKECPDEGRTVNVPLMTATALLAESQRQTPSPGAFHPPRK